MGGGIRLSSADIPDLFLAANGILYAILATTP